MTISSRPCWVRRKRPQRFNSSLSMLRGHAQAFLTSPQSQNAPIQSLFGHCRALRWVP